MDNRKARSHYGVASSQKYDPQIHKLGEAHTWCELEEIWTVDGQMNWYIGKVCVPEAA